MSLFKSFWSTMQEPLSYFCPPFLPLQHNKATERKRRKEKKLAVYVHRINPFLKPKKIVLKRARQKKRVPLVLHGERERYYLPRLLSWPFPLRRGEMKKRSLLRNSEHSVRFNLVQRHQILMKGLNYYITKGSPASPQETEDAACFFFLVRKGNQESQLLRGAEQQKCKIRKLLSSAAAEKIDLY